MEENTPEKLDETKVSEETQTPAPNKIRAGSMEKPSLVAKIKKHKKLLIIIAACSAVLVSLLLFFILKPNNPDTEVVETNSNPVETISGVVVYIDGSLDKKDGEDYIELEIDDILEEGDELRTSGLTSRATILFENGNIARIDGDTELTLTTLKSNQIVLTQANGQVYSRVDPDSDSDYTIETTSGEFVAIGTAFKTSNGGDEESVEVYESTVEEFNSKTSIDKGEKLYLKNTQDKEKEGKTEDLDIEEVKKDDFVIWNRNEDAKIDKFSSSLGFLNDISSPDLNVTSPTDFANILVSSDAKVTFTGTTEPKAEVTILNKTVSGSKEIKAEVSDKGSFEAIDVAGTMGKNVFEVVSKDNSGNKTTKELTVSFKSKSSGTDTPQGSILLKGLGFVLPEKYRVSWSVGDGFSEGEGYMVVWNTTGNPDENSDSIKVDNGTYQTDIPFTTSTDATLYVKVCRYQDNKCTLYSNEHSKFVAGS